MWLDAAGYTTTEYGECEASNLYDDVVQAIGSWDTDHLEWEVTVEGTEPYCPVLSIENYRISTIIPLPNEEMKAYIQEWDFSPYKVIYWNGYSWGDEADVDFQWDPAGAGGGPSHNCIGYPTAFVNPDGANTREGMFFRILDTDTSVCYSAGSGVGLDAGTGVPGAADDGNSAEIVFALLVNG